MKRNHVIIFLLSLSVLISCRKESFMDMVKDYGKTEDPIVAEAKQLFAAEYGRLQASSGLDMSTSPSGRGVAGNKLHPLWDLYKDGNTSKLTAIEIPIVQTQNSIPMYNLDGQASSQEVRLARAKGSFTRLLYFRQGHEDGRQLLVTYVPEYEYLVEKKDRYQKKDIQLRSLAGLGYSGYVEYRELNGRILSVLLFKDGQLKRRYRIQEKSGQEPIHLPRLVQQSSESRKSLDIIAAGGWEDCDWECVPRMYQNCTGNMEAGDNPDETCGDWYETDACDYEIICDETPPDDPYPPYNPCDDPANYWMCGGGHGGGTPPTPPSNQAVKNQIENKPFALIDIPCGIIEAWVATATKEVQQAQINKLNQIVNTTTTRPGITTTTVARLQDINDAYSTVVNMDYFPVTITQLPIINGVRQTPEQFLEHIRKNINSFVDTYYAEFEPYQWYGLDETALWNSSNPLGAVIGIDMGEILEVLDDNGSVIVSDYSSTGWTFSTIFDPKYGQHPVSGHRDFGFTENANGSYTFYTRGVDRLTSWTHQFIQNTTEIPFAQADALWTSFQNMVNSFVNQNGGSSSLAAQQIHRPDWQQVKDVIDGNAPLSTLSKDCPD